MMTNVWVSVEHKVRVRIEGQTAGSLAWRVRSRIEHPVSDQVRVVVSAVFGDLRR